MRTVFSNESTDLPPKVKDDTYYNQYHSPGTSSIQCRSPLVEGISSPPTPSSPLNLQNHHKAQSISNLIVNTNLENLTKRKREPTPKTPPFLSTHFIPSTPNPKRRKRMFSRDRLRDLVSRKSHITPKLHIYTHRGAHSGLLAKSPLTLPHPSSDDDSTKSSESMEHIYLRNTPVFEEKLKDSNSQFCPNYVGGSSSSQSMRKAPKKDSSLYKASICALSTNMVAKSLSELSISNDKKNEKMNFIADEGSMDDVEIESRTSSQDGEESDTDALDDSDMEDFLDESNAVFQCTTPNSPLLHVIRPRVNRKLFNVHHSP